jgi:hypothetical protein
MTKTQTTKLENLRNYETRYELVLTHAETGEKRRLCYTARKNRRGLIDAIFRTGAELGAVTGQKEVVVGQGASAQIGAWRVAFSGRTQREAISSGELAWFRAEEPEAK